MNSLMTDRGKKRERREYKNLNISRTNGALPLNKKDFLQFLIAFFR